MEFPFLCQEILLAKFNSHRFEDSKNILRTKIRNVQSWAKDTELKIGETITDR